MDKLFSWFKRPAQKKKGHRSSSSSLNAVSALEAPPKEEVQPDPPGRYSLDDQSSFVYRPSIDDPTPSGPGDAGSDVSRKAIHRGRLTEASGMSIAPPNSRSLPKGKPTSTRRRDSSDSAEAPSANSESDIGTSEDDLPITGFAVASAKRNADFHELFPDVPEDDYLIEDYGCALQRDILIQGRLYISENHLCFHASVFGWITNLNIPLVSVTRMEKKMTAFVIPDAIVIGTHNSKRTFASFAARNTAFDLIYNIWKLSNPDPDRGGDTYPNAVSGDVSSIPPAIAHKPTTCRCSLDGQHYPNLIMETVYPGTPEQIYNLMFASGFIKDFMTLSQGFTDVRRSDWEPTHPDSWLLIRRVSFIKPLTGAVGPKSVKCELREEMVNADFDHWVGMLTTTTMPDVPSGNVYSIKTKTCIMWAGSLSTKVVVTVTVEWTGRSFIKSTIERTSIEGQQAYYTDLEKAMRSYINEHVSEFLPEGASFDEVMEQIPSPTNEQQSKTTRSLDDNRPSPEHSDVTFCACSREHYPGLAAEFIVPGTPEKLHELLSGSEFIRDFLINEQKVTDFEVSDWLSNREGLSLPARNISYIRPLKGDFGPKWTKCKLREEMTSAELNGWVGTLTTTTVPDLPSGGAFVVKTRTCITRAGKLSAKVLVTTATEWTGKSFIKGIIERGVLEGQQAHYAELERAIRVYIAARPSQFLPEGVSLSEALAQIPPSGIENAPPSAPSTETGPALPSDVVEMHGRLSLSDQNAHLVDLPEAPPTTSGGFCELYIGFHRPSKLKLAMKRPRMLFPTDDMLRRFRREAEIWSTLDHDNIVPFFGTLEIRQRLYLVSPWMALGDLLAFVQTRSEYIEEGKLGEGFADESVSPAYSSFNEHKTIREIASGMEYLHSLSIIHGDMKAKNVLLDDQCCAKICDFGLTKTLDHSVTSTEFRGVGSIRWQSPELLYNQPKSSKSDVYAFALTIVEVLTGNYPFAHLIEQTAVLLAIVVQNERPKQEPTSRLGVDFEPLWKVAARCWPAKPEERPSMTEVLQLLDSSTTTT